MDDRQVSLPVDSGRLEPAWALCELHPGISLLATIPYHQEWTRKR